MYALKRVCIDRWIVVNLSVDGRWAVGARQKASRAASRSSDVT